MINDNYQDNIPTLTDIIQPGDESMKNHFDASVFDHDSKQSDDETETLNHDELKETIDTLIQTGNGRNPAGNRSPAERNPDRTDSATT